MVEMPLEKDTAVVVVAAVVLLEKDTVVHVAVDGGRAARKGQCCW